jgi:hypothetical protein
VSVPGPTGLAQPRFARELWQLDPKTGGVVRLAPVDLPDLGAPLVTLAPGGRQVAYVVEGSPVVSTSLWPTAMPNGPARGVASAAPAVWLTTLDGSARARRVFELPHAASTAAMNAERLIDLVWNPDSAHLVAITRLDGSPARARLFLIDVAPARETADSPTAVELLLLPAEIVPASASVDPTGRWLAFLAHATTASSAGTGLNLCAVELRAGGGFRDLADLGSYTGRPATAPVAWAATGGDSSASHLAFVAPVPGGSTSNGGLLDLFGALRTSAPPSGLFLADLNAQGTQASQPRRLGKLTGVVAPVWRQDGSLLSFVRQNDGALALQAIDQNGAVHGPAAPLPKGAIQGNSVAARWDSERGRALLLSRPAPTNVNADGVAPLQAALLSYMTSPEVTQ